MLSAAYCVQIEEMGPSQSEHNKQLITLTVITLSGFHFIITILVYIIGIQTYHLPFYLFLLKL